MNFICSVLLLIVVPGALSQVISDGCCPEFSGVKDFDMNNYLGIWYGWAKYSFITNAEDRCHYAKYVLRDYPFFTAYNNGIYKANGTWIRQIWDGKLRRPGEMAIEYDNKQNINRSNFYVLNTDYKNWTAAYYCKNLKGNRKEETVFMMTRSRTPSAKHVKEAYDTYRSYNIDTSKLVVNDQKNCPDDSAALAKQI